MWWAIYDRDTRRYPSDYYDETPTVIVKLAKVSLNSLENDDTPYPSHGPIIVYRRKRFSSHDIRTIWLQSCRQCHLCGKQWKLKERARNGWHVDHVIPNNGGGKDTEMMANFLVACARCNLKKGRGYTPRMIRDALRSIFV
jgi:5-methylcytosine-specific restriction endonuclease McrA